MTRPLELMVDIDEVIFPMIATVHERARVKGFHDGSAKMEWAGWLNYVMPDGSGVCTEEAYWDLWTEFALEGGYLTTEPMPGAVEALRFAMWEGHNIHLVTARGFMANADNIRAWTPKWIEDFAVPHKTLTFAKDKVGAQEILGVRFDAAIDDSPKNFAALVNDDVQTYLHLHDHNREFAKAVPYQLKVENLWEWIYRLEQHFPTEATA